MKEIHFGLTFDDVLIKPRYSEVRSRSMVDVATSLRSSQGEELFQLPIMASPMDTVCEWEMAQALSDLDGLGFIHRYMTADEQVAQFSKVNGRCGVAIGLSDCKSPGKSDTEHRLNKLCDAGVHYVLLDIAYGDTDYAVKAIKFLVGHGLVVIAGNVTSAQAFTRLADAGVDAIRVGIGGGSACSTRVTTGVGVPQLSAIIDCAEAAQKTGVTLIADGGIRGPSDIAKALGAGADFVMLGNLLAGTSQSPGKIHFDADGFRYKDYRGMASYDAQRIRQIKLGHPTDTEKIYIEGVVGKVRWKGNVKNVVEDLLKGVRSAFSYVGAHTLQEFRSSVEFIRVTHAGQVESNPHDVLVWPG